MPSIFYGNLIIIQPVILAIKQTHLPWFHFHCVLPSQYKHSVKFVLLQNSVWKYGHKISDHT